MLYLMHKSIAHQLPIPFELERRGRQAWQAFTTLWQYKWQLFTNYKNTDVTTYISDCSHYKTFSDKNMQNTVELYLNYEFFFLTYLMLPVYIRIWCWHFNQVFPMKKSLVKSCLYLYILPLKLGYSVNA